MTIENAFESPTHSCPTPWLPTPLPPMPSLPAPPQPVARRPGNPREQMAAALPGWVQPFLTWLTARPAPGEAYVEIPARYHVVTALALALLAPALAIPCLHGGRHAPLLLPLLQILATAGLGKLQVVIYHHCAHGTVFRQARMNRIVGEAISILLVVKSNQVYRQEHMLHHSPNKLLTEEDEFASFMFGMARLEAGLNRRALWRRFLHCLVSPAFHARFMAARLRSCFRSPSRARNRIAVAFWLCILAGVAAAKLWTAFLLAWVVPATLLFQIATALRTVIEHRFPEADLIERRGKPFVCEASLGVFAGEAVPDRRADTVAGLLAWARWWVAMLTIHLFSRLFVLVGDAPAHDFHHRRPASRKWASYIHARQQDLDAGCPGFPAPYLEAWGLVEAIDRNLDSLSRARGLAVQGLIVQGSIVR